MTFKWLVSGVSGAALLATVACAGPSQWERDRQAATAAYKAGDYQVAEQRFRITVQKAERFGSNDPRLAGALNDLGLTYFQLAKYDAAESLFKRALGIQESRLGPDHPEVADTLNNLAFLYVEQGRYREAEPLHQRALSIRQSRLGPDHIDVATSLNNLARLYEAEGRYAEGVPLCLRAIEILEEQ
ncbi:MAG: tetratricopeptide repeat protein, partial [Kiloniellales bacterium]